MSPSPMSPSRLVIGVGGIAGPVAYITSPAVVESASGGGAPLRALVESGVFRRARPVVPIPPPSSVIGAGVARACGGFPGSPLGSEFRGLAPAAGSALPLPLSGDVDLAFDGLFPRSALPGAQRGIATAPHAGLGHKRGWRGAHPATLHAAARAPARALPWSLPPLSLPPFVHARTHVHRHDRQRRGFLELARAGVAQTAWGGGGC